MLKTWSRSRALLPLRESILQQVSPRCSQPSISIFPIRNYTSPSTIFRLRNHNRFASPRWRSSLFRSARGIRNTSTGAPKPSQEQVTSQKPTGLSAKFRDLSRKYGWAAVGVYLGLSALDFPFCFMAVRWLGTDRIAYAEHLVAEGFWGVVGMVGLDMRSKAEADAPEPATGTAAGIQAGESIAEDTGLEGKHGNASIWTQLLLAYGVHKSLIVFRVPLTAAVTPRIAKWLRARGWNIGNPKAK
ncbi:hypothetical protein B0A50_05767 [Salinomyces thailandicus]|uniref:DUF1279 domain-containing protein n=1 Tax=Salinomyces thailandicus TaxID=706561 RepID=A0A4V5N3S5_9PEZI|nr:hypothetical protein B0A50_05767 [Salinomyces thailandica]